MPTPPTKKRKGKPSPKGSSRRPAKPPKKGPKTADKSGLVKPKDFFVFGEDAIASVATKAITRSDELCCHNKPEEVKGVNVYQDVTAMSSQQVGQLYQYFINLLAYMLIEVTKADQELAAVKYQHDVLKKQYLLKHDTGKEKWRVEAAASADEDIAKAYMRTLECEALRDMLHTNTKGVEQKANMLSREMSRRGMEKT